MNEVSRSKIAGRIKFSDAERIRLAKLGHELGRKALEGEVECQERLGGLFKFYCRKAVFAVPMGYLGRNKGRCMNSPGIVEFE